ncbi:MAG: DUF58 domain-containing protein [Candidatus Eremiobacteraeota bacterium]|nr:DUF58 domain-containing protein [Candidatus Eremiobacteraeota bacterium]
MTIREALLKAHGRPRISGTGSALAYRGEGYEFAELRAYAAGDDVRRIDWAATARSGDLQVRVMLEEVALTLAVIHDTSPSMNVGRTRLLACAAEEAHAAWFRAARPQDRCIRIDPVRPQRFCLAASLVRARRMLPRGAALLVVSDWHDLPTIECRDLIACGARFDCTALVARDPWHDDFPLAGLVRFRGAEGGTARVFVGTRERKNYYDAVRARESAVFARLSSAGWRTGLLHEADGMASLRATFGARA